MILRGLQVQKDQIRVISHNLASHFTYSKFPTISILRPSKSLLPT